MGASQIPSDVEQRELIGREREREELRALVAGARDGRSAALVVRGEPGIGKSALLEDAAAQGERATVLRASGVGSETELPFSGLSELLGPLTGAVEALPPPQAAALAGALAIGPTTPGDPLTVAAGTLSLLSLGAEDHGLVAIIDDAQWLDSASLQALAFAARRLGVEGVALIFAIRGGEASLLDEAGLPELLLEPLTAASARELLGQAEPGMVRAVAEVVLETAAGNPLALIEIPRALSKEEATGLAPIVEPLRPGASLERAYLRQLEGAPASVCRALLVAATAEPDEGEALARALPSARAAWADLDWAESAGIVSLEHGIRFRHPVLRSAIYHAAPAADRRAAHQALADGLKTWDAFQRIAWHRALAQASPDEDVAAALAEAGSEARLRNAPSVAARALERAAELTPDSETRARRRLAAAENLAGRAQHALDLLERALIDTEAPELRLAIQQLRGRTFAGTGRGVEAHALLTGEGARLETADPGQAALLHAEASYGALVSGRPRQALASGERAFSLAQEVGGEALLAATLVLAYGLIHVGEVERGAEALDSSLRALEQADPLLAWQPLMGAASFVAVLGREEESRAICLHLTSTFRSLSAPGLLCLPVATLAHLEWRLGRWQEARATGTEAVELCRSASLEGFRIFALTGLARLDGSQGRGEECRANGIEALDAARRTGSETGIPYALAALVLGALGDGDVEEAVVHGEELARFYKEHGYRSPGTFQWHGDVIEAYILAGRRDDAEKLLESFSDEAKATQHPWALPVASRCRGLLTDDGSFEDAMAESLRLHAAYRHPFERARTELALGERRRRARRRTDARAPLRSALATFESLRAEPWAKRARTELQASGARPRRREAGLTDELTPHELRVAQVVARGATNREAAAGLFLSPKTIDFHLRNVYRKLGVRSRTELAARIQVGAVEPN